MYVLVWSPGIGVVGWDWIWVLLGVGLDIMKWGQIANKRKEIPGYPAGYERLPQTACEADIPRSPHTAATDTDAELEQLADLRDKGIITAEEYEAKKQQLGE
jgi:hypothetical protein